MLKYPDMKIERVAIIGAGEIGLALGGVIAQKAEVFYWDKNEKKLLGLSGEDLSLPEIMTGAQAIFLCLPTAGLKEAIFCLSPYLRADHILITLAKGLEEGTGRTALEFVSKIIHKGLVGALAGPLVAEEIAGGRPGAGVLVGKGRKMSAVAELFAGSKIKISFSTDLIGASLAGVLKNIYALGAGMGEALGWGSNARALYLTEAQGEILDIGKMLGGKTVTLLGPAGLGDFLATALSKNSANFYVGWQLARQEKIDRSSEGLVSLPLLLGRLGNRAKNFPVLMMLKKIILDDQSAEEIFRQGGLI